MILELIATCWLVAGQPMPIRGVLPVGWDVDRYVVVAGQDAVILRRAVTPGERIELPPGCRPLPEEARR